MVPAVVLAPFNGALGNSLPKRTVLTGSTAYCFLIVARLRYPGRPLGMPLGTAGNRRCGLQSNALCDFARGRRRYAHPPHSGQWLDRNGRRHCHHCRFRPGNPPGKPVLAPSARGGDSGLRSQPCGCRHCLPVSSPMFAGRKWPSRRSAASFATAPAYGATVNGARIGPGLFACRRRRRHRSIHCRHAQRPIRRHGDADSRPVRALDVDPFGAGAGSLLAGVQRHPRRALGLVPLGATGLALGLISPPRANAGHFMCFLLGAMGGLVNVPLAAAYQIFCRPTLAAMAWRCATSLTTSP